MKLEEEISPQPAALVPFIFCLQQAPIAGRGNPPGSLSGDFPDSWEEYREF
jgi:hypothetical protein